jgi:TolB-like protein
MAICVVACASPAWAQGGLDQRVSELSQQIASKMSAKQKTTIAVVEFTDLQGNVTDFGRFLAEELVTRLGDLEKFKVIERQLLNKIIAEQKLSLTGIVDPASAKQLGKILGVDAIVAGSVTNLAQSVRVNARLISTETGEVFATAAADIFKDESVTGLLSGTTSNPKLGMLDATQNKSATQRVVAKEFTFELNSCKMSANTVRCYLSITNESASDRDLILKTSSRLFDEAGEEYVAGESSLMLGSRTMTYTFEDRLRNGLVSKVPTKALIRFLNVSPQASKATLSVECNDDRADFKVTFRNVQITK